MRLGDIVEKRQDAAVVAAEDERGLAVDRRWALKAAGVTGIAAVLAGRAGSAGAIDSDNSASAGDGDRGRGVEPGAGNWRTWALSSGSEITVPPPPKGNAAKADLKAVETAVARRDSAMLEAIGFWDTGWHGYRWMQIAMQAVAADPAPDTFRVAAYTAIAIHDATIASWAAKQRDTRKRPYEQKKSLPTVGVRPDSPSYPSEHGAAAGAAVGILSHLYPAKKADFEAKADAHAAARVAAGLEFPSDFAAGYKIGEQAAAKLVAVHISVDGFGAKYQGNPDVPYPGGDGSFPILPKDEGFQIMVGKWKTLVLDDVTAFRPPAPPAKGSAKRAEELAEVKAFPRRNPPQFSELFFWAEDPAGRPEPDSGAANPVSAAFYYAVDVAFIALEDLNRAVLEYRLDANPPRASRAYALTLGAMLDAYIACWESKYHFLVGRPIHFDPTVDDLWETYPLAAYPSGHSCNLTAVATMMGYLFPRDAHYFLSRAKENALSRLWAGIHFRSDSEEGVRMGQRVGNAIVDWAKTDGS